MQNLKNLARLVLVVAMVAAVGVFCYKTLRPKPATSRTVTVHCGNSMRVPAELLAKDYLARTGRVVEFNFGGAEALMPQIKTQRTGDVFICHDPFGQQLKDEKLLGRAVVVGRLEPVIIVAKGNPKGIKSLADLVKPGLRVGTTDPRYATCGQLVEDKLRVHGWAKSFSDHPNFVLQTRTHGDVATGVVTGQLDAGLVWRFIANSFAAKVDTVVTGETFAETKVTVCQLTCAANPEAAVDFLELAASPAGQKIFTDHGY